MQIIHKILNENLNIDNNTFIFDIETTGLNSKYCKVILIGILYNCHNQTIIKQFFAENEDDEKELLTTFVDNIKNFKNHITYNGLGFDINFLNYRLKKHNIDYILNKEDDFDILKFIRPFKNDLGLIDCSLSTVENYFGIYREDIITGKESIKLYKEFEENKNEDLKNIILLHNYEDIYNLGKLINIKDRIKDKLDLIKINSKDKNLELYPSSYKINSKKLTMDFFVFSGDYHNISIYKDSYSISSNDDHIFLEININKGVDKDENNILFYNMSQLIPLKYNDSLLEKNIYSLCNFIIKNELSNI